MKASYINKTGPANIIQYGELPAPKPNASECLIKVGAVDVNPLDVYIRSGMVPAKLTFPHILGRDVAGTVAECGSIVTKFKPGDRVWASNQGFDARSGTFAEFAVVDEVWLHAIPKGISDEDIVALSLVAITAHLGLVNVAKLQPGETLFVNGGTGGVGSCVVQIAKILGARVMTTGGSDDKVRACLELGADLAINYKTQDVDAAIKNFAPNGINLWWETLREPNFERALPLLSSRGRIVIMAGRDARPVFPVGPFYTKNCSVHGFAMFNFSAEEQRPAANDVNQWLAQGLIRPRIDRVLPLAQTAVAHQLQEESTIGKKGTLAGKLVLKP
jgi:NADPH2:quinone reductase